ncbi:MAG: hypothetical protein IJN21_09190 [Clostridia bacterium]|nr:hypothetical protein [Clostridia bacterium]
MFIFSDERSVSVENHISYISDGTISYLMQQFPSHAEKWLSDFPHAIERLKEKWQLTFKGHERNSRFGTILYAESRVYGDVAVKIVPWFCPRLKSEIECYRSLPYREMCDLYDVDEKLGAMLLKYVEEKKDATADKALVFSSLFEQRRPALERDYPLLYPYRAVLEDVLSNAGNVINGGKDSKLSVFLPSIQKAQAAISLFENDEKYIIHGDAHEYNMLGSENGCVLIDPLGYIAPFAFEYARYLGTAMKENEMSPDDFFRLCEKVFAGDGDIKKNLTAFAIDVTLRACNTFIEGNTYDEILFSGSWARRAWAYLEKL